MKTGFLILLMVICFGCTTKTAQQVPKISFESRGQTLKISGLNNVVVQDINRDTTTNKWQQLIPVYSMPVDTDMKDFQPVQPGNYLVKGGVIFFTPDTPFKHHQQYFIRYYHHDEDREVWSFITGKRRVGKVNYTDLIFKR